MLIDILSLPDTPTVINGIHESNYRCWNVLRLAKDMLKTGVPAMIVIGFIEDVKTIDSKDLKV